MILISKGNTKKKIAKKKKKHKENENLMLNCIQFIQKKEKRAEKMKADRTENFLQNHTQYKYINNYIQYN